MKERPTATTKDTQPEASRRKSGTLEVVRPEDAPRSARVADLAAELASIESFPHIVQRIRAAVSDPKTSLADVARLVENDIGISADFLRYANAPTSGLVKRCSSVRHAVTLLGFDRAAEIVASVAALAFVERVSSRAPAVAAHSVAMAGVARMLAGVTSVSPDEAFTAALLHDVGILLLVQLGDPFYEGLLEPQYAGDEPSLEDERALMGFDHGALGAEILRQWRLPDPLPRVVGLHHDWDAAVKAGGLTATMVALLRAADAISAWLNVKPAPATIADLDVLFEEPGFAYLGLRREELFSQWQGFADACQRALALAQPEPEAAPLSAPVVPKPAMPPPPPAAKYVAPAPLVAAASSMAAWKAVVACAAVTAVLAFVIYVCQ